MGLVVLNCGISMIRNRRRKGGAVFLKTPLVKGKTTRKFSVEINCPDLVPLEFISGHPFRQLQVSEKIWVET